MQYSVADVFICVFAHKKTVPMNGTVCVTI